MADIFLDNNGIVRGPLVIHEAGLAGANDFCQERLQLGGYDLDDKLILGITKAYGYKVLKRSGIPTFRDEAQISRIYFGVHRVGGKCFLIKFLNGRVGHSFPKFLVQKGM